MNGPVVAVHAGAGGPGSTATLYEAECRMAVQEALADARAVLERGGDAVAAVRAAVVSMEDYELFNAGRGSVLCDDGTVELSAALMSSDGREAGAVAAVRRIRNPIDGAAVVMRSPQVLMVGPAADAMAAAAGVEQVAPEHFVTERQRERLLQAQAGLDHNTVGAVCLDAAGRLAAGTSTGGLRAQPPGRVGDCPLIGAGTWADAFAAVSCTGDGEAFIRSGTARSIALLVEQGLELEAACRRALRDIDALGAIGGLIALDRAGNVTMPLAAEVMPRGVWRPGEEPRVWIVPED